MATDGLYARPALQHSRQAPVAAELAFVALLLLVFVGFTPFAVRDPAVLALGESGFSGAGDIARQICYIVVLGVILATSIGRAGPRALRILPIPLMLLLGWCLASSLWAIAAPVTVRRAGLEIVVVLCAMLSVETLGAERALTLLRTVLAVILIVNWLSIPLVPHLAIHQANESDPSIIGDWRGLYFHKNIAGGICAVSAIVFFYFAVERRRRLDIVLFIATLGFLIGTHSKSSMGLLPVALLMGAVYRWGFRRDLDRGIVAVCLILITAVIAVVAIVDSGAISRILEDPAEFTGRTQIWWAEIAFIADHPLLGSGFGSFADTGALSPLHRYVSADWVNTVAHGHNAYLQLTVTIGFVGFALAMLSLLIQPAIAFWKRRGPAMDIRAWLFALFVFVLLHNLVESDFLEGDDPVWFVFVLMIAMLRLPKPRNEAMA